MADNCFRITINLFALDPTVWVSQENILIRNFLVTRVDTLLRWHFRQAVLTI